MPHGELVQEISTSFQIWTRPFGPQKSCGGPWDIRRHRVRLKFVSELLKGLQGRPLTTTGHFLSITAYKRYETSMLPISAIGRLQQKRRTPVMCCRRCGYRIANSRDTLILDKKSWGLILDGSTPFRIPTSPSGCLSLPPPNPCPRGRPVRNAIARHQRMISK